MCEYVSFVVDTESFAAYLAPGLNSHGNARAGWGMVGGAEAEWTGEGHESLTVRYEDKALAGAIRQYYMDKYPNRTAFLATVTETRGPEGTRAWYRNGEREFREDEVGPKYAELNAFLAKLKVTPWLKPGKELGAAKGAAEAEAEAKLMPLVQEHLRCLTVHSGIDLSHVTLRVVRTVDDYNAARNAAIDAAYLTARNAAYDAARNAAIDAAYNAAYWTAYNAAYWTAREAAWNAVWNTARNAAIGAARNAGHNAGHMASALPDNPWAPLYDCMALGAMPVGIVDNAFVVWIPNE